MAFSLSIGDPGCARSFNIDISPPALRTVTFIRGPDGRMLKVDLSAPSVFSAPSSAVAAPAERQDGGTAFELEERDIALVMEEAKVDREKAIAALLKHDKDVVDAIVNLTQ